VIHFFFSCSFFFEDVDSTIILSNLDLLLVYNSSSLPFIKYGVLNNNLTVFKHIFMYVRSFHILIFFSLNLPIQINLNIKNFILSNFK
jgi:hypothetical protein